MDALLAEYDRYIRRRGAQSRLENIGRAHYQDWHDIDDWGVDLLDRLVNQVRGTS